MEHDEIRSKVRDQYERFPYPAPRDDLAAFRHHGGYANGCPWHNFHWYWPHRNRTQDLDILVAGCGTSQAAKVAFHVPRARVVAIDLSPDSITHTKQLLVKHDIKNVEIYEMSLESVGKLGKQFDLIVCTGVLHHLPDPAAGLRALRDLLRPEGSMYLMVYGHYGRDGVYYMQNIMRRLGITPSNVTEDDIASIRELIGLLPATHNLRAKMPLMGNLDSANEIVDLFLHQQDRAYTIPGILEFLNQCDLKLQRFILGAQYLPRFSGLARSAFYARINRLPFPEQWAITEAFRASTLMHFFIACHRERPESSYMVDLYQPEWKTLKPVRNPGVQRIPPNPGDVSAGQLFWPPQQFPEMRRGISPLESKLIERSTGDRSIAQIVAELETDTGCRISDEEVLSFYRDMQDLDYVWFTSASL
jgi:SAM-dependent methyltransferase